MPQGTRLRFKTLGATDMAEVIGKQPDFIGALVITLNNDGALDIGFAGHLAKLKPLLDILDAVEKHIDETMTGEGKYEKRIRRTTLDGIPFDRKGGN